MLIGLTAALVAAALFGAAAVAQAVGVRRMSGGADNLASFVRQGLRDPLIVGVVVAYLLGFVLHAVAIWYLPLYLAQATIAASMPVTAICSAVLLKEPMRPVDWASVAAVTGGLVLLSVGAGSTGDVESGATFVVLVWAGVLVCTVGGFALMRQGGSTVGGVLGALAGCGYAGSAIAVRGLPDDWQHPGTVGVLIALAVPVFGLVAFWTYSVALDRDSVTAATAALIVTQTFVPAFVGLAALGDGVRAGWWPGIVVGLLLSVGGAIWLGRSQAAQDVGAAH